jgi:hypothetical protein
MKGAKALKISETDLFDILQSALGECIVKFSQKNIEIEFLNTTTNSFIKGDYHYLIKCFTAVLDNAFKFSPKGDKIEIRLNNVSDGFVSITITDRGKGFSKGSLDNIYSALSNLEAHFDQNTGMGLHLAKLIVDAHSGFMKVGNCQPTGAIIQIMIPSR